MIDRIEKWFYRICTGILVTILLCITIFALMQVCGRYIFHRTFFWVEEITAILLGWMVAMGAPAMWLKKGHIMMDAIDQILPRKIVLIWDCVIDAAGIAVGIIFVIAGMKAFQFNSGYSISLLRYDESVRYIFVPVMGGLLASAAVITLIRDALKVKEG